VWTWILRLCDPVLRQRSISVSVSFSGAFASAILFVFSRVTSVVFTLVECTSYSGVDSVVFIDGTVPCMDSNWVVIVCIAAFLFCFPVLFAVALRQKKFPRSARDSLCSQFTEPMSSWAAVSLAFRLLISITQFLQVEYPNMLAFSRLFLSVGVLIMLLHLRPYTHERAHWVDVACHICLIARFGLQIFGADRDYFGVAESSDQESFFSGISIFSTTIM
jgi:hypothetical protein